MPSMDEASIVGKRVGIRDAIFNVEAENTPLLSMLPAGDVPVGMLDSWQAEVYPDVGNPGIVDGTPATAPKSTGTHLIEMYAQHFRQEWGVTDMAQLTDQAGTGKNQAGRQMKIAMVLLKRQIEQRFLSDSDTVQASGVTPYGTRGAFSYLQSTAQTTKPIPAAVRPASANSYTGAIASFDELQMQAMLASMAAERKGPVSLMCPVGTTLKNNIDTWTNYQPASITSNARILWAGKDPDVFRKVVRRVETSNGTLDLFLSYFILKDATTGADTSYTAKSGLFLDMSMWNIGWHSKPSNLNLPDDGSGKKGTMDAYLMFRCMNPKGQGRVYTAS